MAFQNPALSIKFSKARMERAWRRARHMELCLAVPGVRRPCEAAHHGPEPHRDDRYAGTDHCVAKTLYDTERVRSLAEHGRSEAVASNTDSGVSRSRECGQFKCRREGRWRAHGGAGPDNGRRVWARC